MTIGDCKSKSSFDFSNIDTSLPVYTIIIISRVYFLV